MPLCLSTFSGTDRQNCVSGYLVYGLESCTPFLFAADELAYRRVLSHDVHGLQFRGRVYGACDEMYQRSVYLYVAPALSPAESVYLNLPDCLQTYPFGAYITGIGVLQIHAFTNQSSVI